MSKKKKVGSRQKAVGKTISFTTEETMALIGDELIEKPCEDLLYIMPYTDTKKNGDEVHGLAVFFLDKGATASYWYFTKRVNFNN